MRDIWELVYRHTQTARMQDLITELPITEKLLYHQGLVAPSRRSLFLSPYSNSSLELPPHSKIKAK